MDRRHGSEMEGTYLMPRTPKAGERRDRMIGVHVSEEEYERLRALAFEARKSIPALIRDRMLGQAKTKK